MQKARFALLLALAFSTICVASKEKELAFGLAKAGSRLASQSKPEKAKTLYFKALAHDEECAEALLGLAEIYQDEGNDERAVVFYGRLGNEQDPFGVRFDVR